MAGAQEPPGGRLADHISLGVLSAAFSRDLPRPDRISFIRAVRIDRRQIDDPAPVSTVTVLTNS